MIALSQNYLFNMKSQKINIKNINEKNLMNWIEKNPVETKEKYYGIIWDEDNTKWTAYDSEESPNSFNWDASALSWVPA